MPFAVPDACTLPTAEQPARLAEFGTLLAAVHRVERVSPTHARLHLTGPPSLAKSVRDLTAREAGCCSFFTFGLTTEDGSLTLDIRVPSTHADVLTALTATAAAPADPPADLPANAPGNLPGDPPAGRPGSPAAASGGLRTGEVAHRAGVNIQTLRYYERRGLLEEPARSLGGHRLYPPGTVALIGAIKAAQRLGFTLDEVADLIEPGREPGHGRRPGPGRGRHPDAGLRHPGPDLRRSALDKITEIDARIAGLTTIRATLTRVVEADCDSLTNCTCADCPIPTPTG